MPLDISERFRYFRSTHPITRLTIDGHQWEYTASGNGAEMLILLPGGFGVAETSFLYIIEFDTQYRVLSLTYPATVTTVAQVVDGIVGVMAAEKIEKAHFLGGSYSGMIAQCLVHQYPERVDKLILSQAGVPTSSRAKQHMFFANVLSILPMTFARPFMKLMKYVFLFEITEEQNFWRDYFNELIDACTKAEFVNRFLVAADFDRHYHFEQGGLVNWPGQILILETDDDWLFPDKERQAQKALYPQAHIHTFCGGGHSAAIDKPQGHIDAIQEFLSKPGPASFSI